MYSLFLPIAGEEVYVVVATPTSKTDSQGANEFQTSCVAGEVVQVKRDPGIVRGFKVRVNLLERVGAATEVVVSSESVVRTEYLSMLSDGEVKALIAAGLVPIVSDKHRWKKAKTRSNVFVSPGSFGKEDPAAGPNGTSAPKKVDVKASAPATGEAASKPIERPWKRLLDKDTPDIAEHYDLRDVLGKGNYGTTRIAVDKKTKRRFACKTISKRKLACQEDVDDVKREIELLHHLGGHQNVIGFKGVFEDRTKIHLVMELCTGGELFDRIVDRGHYSEKDAAQVVRSMLRVVAHCHNLGVIHRDLKPENFLLADRSDNAELKAIDFGLSVYFKEGEKLKELAGSAFYIAPEVLRKNYSKECDIWSCGIILYILLSGMPPFFGNSENQIFESIMKDPLDLKSDPWPGISDAAKDVVKKMLVHDPSKRATADEVLQHEWMRENGVASDKPLGNTFLERIKGFAQMNKLKKEALMVIAKNLPKEEIEGLKQMFQSLDVTGKGVIPVGELRKGLQSKGKIPEAEMELLLKNIDVDGNGLIDYEEFLAATLNTMKLDNEDQLVKAFEHFDKDGSGTITKDELMAIFRNCDYDIEIEKVLKEVDKDGDGQIDFEEFKAMMLQ
ncbi:hypothetical protein BSKO_07394 [Bryopsis sp. KO-2023]|nr:hypothetical protein BSKO_07394 [Bryopsis sp. KO-2023]